jgi:5'-3' exonuclease
MTKKKTSKEDPVEEVVYMEPDVALIDADSMIYMAAYTADSYDQAEERLINKIEEICVDLETPEAIVFVKGDNNFRYQCNINYKSHRLTELEEDVKERLDKLYAFAQANFVKCDNGEADDYCSIYLHKLIDEGKYPVVVHIDKDLNMIPGYHYNFRKKDFYYLSFEEAYVFLMRQLMTGDRVDGIPGIYKCGPAKASLWLNGKRSKDMLGEVLRRWQHYGGDSWKEDFTRDANCLFLRSHEDDLRPFSYDELIERFTWLEEGDMYLPNRFNDILFFLQRDPLPKEAHGLLSRPFTEEFQKQKYEENMRKWRALQGHRNVEPERTAQ